MKLLPKAIATLFVSLVASGALAQTTLLNASYDVARDVYKDYNPLFQKHWKATTGEADEYDRLPEKKISPAVASTIASWLQTTMGKR